VFQIGAALAWIVQEAAVRNDASACEKWDSDGSASNAPAQKRLRPKRKLFLGGERKTRCSGVFGSKKKKEKRNNKGRRMHLAKAYIDFALALLVEWVIELSTCLFALRRRDESNANKETPRAADLSSDFLISPASSLSLWQIKMPLARSWLI
jgi:Flp pilus assembly protein TadB